MVVHTDIRPTNARSASVDQSLRLHFGGMVMRRNITIGHRLPFHLVFKFCQPFCAGCRHTHTSINPFLISPNTHYRKSSPHHKVYGWCTTDPKRNKMRAGQDSFVALPITHTHRGIERCRSMIRLLLTISLKIKSTFEQKMEKG